LVQLSILEIQTAFVERQIINLVIVKHYPSLAKVVLKLKSCGVSMWDKKGLIGRYGKKRSYASEWRLTEFKCDMTGQLPTHAYRHWQGLATPISTKDYVHRAQSNIRDAA